MSKKGKVRGDLGAYLLSGIGCKFTENSSSVFDLLRRKKLQEISGRGTREGLNLCTLSAITIIHLAQMGVAVESKTRRLHRKWSVSPARLRTVQTCTWSRPYIWRLLSDLLSGKGQ